MPVPWPQTPGEAGRLATGTLITDWPTAERSGLTRRGGLRWWPQEALRRVRVRKHGRTPEDGPAFHQSSPVSPTGVMV